jgi:hypothetical protein
VQAVSAATVAAHRLAPRLRPCQRQNGPSARTTPRTQQPAAPCQLRRRHQ